MKPDRNHRIIRKKSTNKIIDRLTYNPDKHKQKSVKKMRLNLQNKPSAPIKQPCPPPTTMKFGSINVNGLDLEAGWAVQQLLENKGFNVSSKRRKYIHILLYIGNKYSQRK